MSSRSDITVNVVEHYEANGCWIKHIRCTFLVRRGMRTPASGRIAGSQRGVRRRVRRGVTLISAICEREVPERRQDASARTRTSSHRRGGATAILQLCRDYVNTILSISIFIIAALNPMAKDMPNGGRFPALKKECEPERPSALTRRC